MFREYSLTGDQEHSLSNFKSTVQTTSLITFFMCEGSSLLANGILLESHLFPVFFHAHEFDVCKFFIRECLEFVNVWELATTSIVSL